MEKEIFTKENDYEIEGVKISFYYDQEIDGIVICGGRGKLKALYIPNKINGIDVKEVDGSASDFLGGIEKIIVSEDHLYLSTIDGVLFNKEKTQLIWYPSEKAGISYSVPMGVSVIGESAFCSQYLLEVVLPDGLASIDVYAFAVSKKLERITIPRSLKQISLKAFYFCGSLREVYYEGTEEQWHSIDFSLFNEALQNASIHFNVK